MPGRSKQFADALYAELVSTLYKTLVPTIIMSAGYVGSLSLMALSSGDVVIWAFAGSGLVSGAARIGVIIKGAPITNAPAPNTAQLSVLERTFAVAYYQFAVLLGLSGAYVFAEELPRYHMLMLCLVLGYGAGAAAGVGLRPHIAIPSMLLATVPSIIAMMLRRDEVYWATAMLTAALLAGGCLSLIARFRKAKSGIGERLVFQNLARRDALTTLPNRLALKEWFEDNSSIGDDDERIAIHCLDLDKFKPVNDTYGHPIGDEVLKIVAARLRKALRTGDIVSRLGGDEFVVIQRNVSDIEEASSLARRLRRTISERIDIRQHTVQISGCVGYVVCGWNSGDLEELLALADETLYRAKKSESGIESAPSIGEHLDEGLGDPIAA